MKKKSYKGLLLWVVVFTTVMFAISALPAYGPLLTRITLNYMFLMIFVLMLIIHFDDKIYWITGVEYEQAAKLTREQRKACSIKYVRVFGIAALVFLAVSVAFHLLDLPYYNDIFVSVVLVIYAAISTIKFKL